MKHRSEKILLNVVVFISRSAARIKEAAWPTIAGVGLLSPTSLDPSPKVPKREPPAASQRRGRLSRAVKEKTPKKPSLTGTEAEPGTSPVLVKERTPLKSPVTVKRKTPKKSLLGVEEETPSKSPLIFEISNVECGSSKKMPRLSRKSGGFTVSDIPAVTLSGKKETPKSFTIIEETADDVELSVANSVGRPKRSINSKKRQSLREKENVPAVVNVAAAPSAEDSFSLSLPEMDAVDSIIVSSRRMSIHEPSPPVHVSPENLLNGMVPAQFSPFVTSARGKDKYSLHKRRKF